MATNANRTSTRKPALQPHTALHIAADADVTDPAAPGDAPAPALDTTLDAWSLQATRDQLAWEIGTCSALLRGARAWREAQMQTAERAEAARLQAAEQLLGARGIGDLAGVQLELLRADTEETMQFWSRLGEVATRSALEAFQQAAAGWARLSGTAWNGLTEWTRLQASLQQGSDLVAAEVEHLANPLAASPLVWPAQEAARQAMTLASSTWNDWVSWSHRLAEPTAQAH